MINIKSIKLLGVAAFFGVFASCDSDNEPTAIVDIEKPTMTIDIASAVTVNEGESIPFTVTLSEPVGKPFSFFILRNSSSSADGHDSSVENQSGVTFEQKVTVPAFVTTYSSAIMISEDCSGESTETLTLTLGDTRTSAVNVVPATTTVTIINTISDDLNLHLAFDKDFSIGPDDYSLCDIGYDVDFIVYNADYSEMIEDYSAQTGNCPEALTFNLDDSNYPDGTYHITAYLYGTGGLEDAPYLYPFDIPVTVTYDRCGSLTSALADDGGSFVANEGFTSLSTAGEEVYIATVTILNGQFTITNDEQVVVSGRAARVRNVNKVSPVASKTIN